MVEYSNTKTINPVKFIKMSYVRERLINLGNAIVERFGGKIFNYADFSVGCIDIHITLDDFIDISLWYEYTNPDVFEIKVRDFELGLIYVMHLAPVDSINLKQIVEWIEEKLLELKMRRV